MIISLTPNPALDVTYTFDELHVGQTHRVPPAVARGGGKGVNVARVAHAQGYDVRALITSGGVIGASYLAELDEAGLPYSAIEVSGDTRQSIALVASGDATVLNEYGVPLTDAEREAVIATFSDQVASATVATISGSLPRDTPSGFLTQLVQAGHGRPLIVDTSGPGLLEAARAGAQVLKPNDLELREATGKEDIAEGMRALLDLGAEMVFTSLGEEGIVVGSENSSLQARLPYVLQGNPTGAGDALVAAIATSIDDAGDLFEIDLRQVLRRASAWSAAAVLMPQAGEISVEHEKFYDDVVISEGTL